MTRLQNNRVFYIVLSFISTIFFVQILLLEIFFATTLKRVETMSNLLFVIEALPAFRSIYFVNFSMNASAMNFTYATFLTSVSFISGINIAANLILHDLLKYRDDLKSLRVHVKLSFLLTVFKYLAFLIIILMNYSNFMTPTPLFNAIANATIIINVIIFINIILYYVRFYLLGRRSDLNVRVS
ncbi:MAG: hypothetical protein GX074_02835 [Erysipelothrix sp.]|nr:hypothetical protein [Erysipelothrix sp.]